MEKVRTIPACDPFVFFGDNDKVCIWSDRFNEDGSPKVLDIDQFSMQPFMLNSCGFPMNDIMAYNESESESIARAVLQRVSVQHPEPNIPQDVSLDDQFASIVPASWSTSTEYVRAQKHFAEMGFEAYQQKQASLREKEAKIDFTETETPLNDA